jgi:hypothetical protein
MPADVYAEVCAEMLIDPAELCREIDELLILWHTEYTVKGQRRDTGRPTGKHAAPGG